MRIRAASPIVEEPSRTTATSAASRHRVYDPELSRREILPRLGAVKLSQIVGATGGCDDGWVLRTSLIGEIDAVLAAVDGLLGQWVPERALEFVLAGNASMSADSW